MWEDLKVYKQLDKKEINPAFKKFGAAILAELADYKIEQTQSVIKIYRERNGLEQAVFIEKGKGGYDLKVKICIKPADFYRRHKFTMVYVTALGDIMNNYRRTSYPLTMEWQELAVFLATRIKNEIERHFERYGTYEKIIADRERLEAGAKMDTHTYPLLIYAAIRTKNRSLLLRYVDVDRRYMVSFITYSEFLKPGEEGVNEGEFLQRLKVLGEKDDFVGIEEEIAKLGGR